MIQHISSHSDNISSHCLAKIDWSIDSIANQIHQREKKRVFSSQQFGFRTAVQQLVCLAVTRLLALLTFSPPRLLTRAANISDFHYTIIMAYRIHSIDIITISIENRNKTTVMI